MRPPSVEPPAEPIDPAAHQSRWARVLHGSDWQPPLGDLAASYSYCVYAWWRRSGLAAPEAAAATVASFTRWLTSARPSPDETGSARMREWLPARLAELAAPGMSLDGPAAIRIDAERAEARYANEPAGPPNAIFHRRWALTVLELAVAALRAEYAGRGEEALFPELLPFAGYEPGSDDRYAAAAARTGRTGGAMKKAVFDFRKRERALLLALAGDTLLDPSSAESEITALLCACDAPAPDGASAPLPAALGTVHPDEMLARAMESVAMTGRGGRGWQPPTIEEAARLFPQYEILSLLGRGGMGAVYKGRQRELDRLVAIKLLPLEVSVDRDFAARFRREARAMARLNHPNIITIHEFGATAEGHLFFVMEFVDGANLHQMIHGPGLTPAQALDIVGGVCDALAYAHAEEVVHRDIKPANVMVSVKRQVKVADFGLARLTDSAGEPLGHTTIGMVMGTPDYMAPEQRRGMNVDQRADVYSLGVTLYEMLCREVPHGIFDPPSIRLPGCHRSIDQVVIKAMQQQPERRYQSTTEMKLDVIAASAMLSRTPAPPLASAPRAKPPKSQKPLWIGMVAAAVALAAAAFHFAPWKKSAPSGSVQQSDPIRANPMAPPASAISASFALPATSWQNLLADKSVVNAAVGAGSRMNGRTLELIGQRNVMKQRSYRNGAVRLRTVFDKIRAPSISVRERDWPERYIASVQDARTVKLVVMRGGIPKDLRIITLPTPLVEGREYQIELGIVGSLLTVRLDGALLATQEDTTLPGPGHFGVWNVGDDPRIIQGLDFLDLDDADAAAAYIAAGPHSTPQLDGKSVTQDAPLINSLGMKFVPVPIVGGPTDKQPVLFSVWDTRVQDYAEFVKETNREWQKPAFEQGPTHPAVNVSWEDAQLFCQWLTAREQAAGRLPADWRYRLPSDHEWSCAAGIGVSEDAAKTPGETTGMIDQSFPWGTQWPPPAGAGNYAGEELRPALADPRYEYIKAVITGYHDGFVYTSAVGSFRANQFGLYDMGGNVWQWCEDSFGKDQKLRTLRGAAWNTFNRDNLRSSNRVHHTPTDRFDWYGFRCVAGGSAPSAAESSPAAPKEPPSSPPTAKPSGIAMEGKARLTETASAMTTATRDAPFINSLGMRFVPVPILGGPTGGQRVLLSIWDTRVQDYAEFVNATKREWKKPDFAQGPTHPAVDVSWEDARLFCQWLTAREQAALRLPPEWRYRLPSDHEWSCAAGLAGEDASKLPAEKKGLIGDAYPWGAEWPPPEKAGNYASEELKPLQAAGEYANIHELLPGYYDGYANTSPVGTYAANRFGLYDMGGNVRQWCEEWYDQKQEDRVTRGASWVYCTRALLRSSFRSHAAPGRRSSSDGFRCALVGVPTPAIPTTAPATPPTKEPAPASPN